jgi:hypothetical protein
MTLSAFAEPRDLYDLWHLVSHEDVELDQLLPAITSKLALRDLESVGIQEAIAKKEARVKILWVVRLANQLSELPPFDQVFREFGRAIRQSGLPSKHMRSSTQTASTVQASRSTPRLQINYAAPDSYPTKLAI